MNKPEIEQLKLIVTCTWDGDLISKDARDELVKRGLAQRAHGYNWLTKEGVMYLTENKFLVP